MFQFLFFTACGIVWIVAYLLLARSYKNATRDMDNARAILQLTTTNNSYDLLEDVFSSLDVDLGELEMTLHTDMRGYMDGE